MSPDRAAQLGDVFQQFMGAMSGGDDDLESQAKRLQKMQAVIEKAKDFALSPSWSTRDPEPGTRAHRAIQILDPLKRYILTESVRPMLPSDEKSAGTDLLSHLFQLEQRIRDWAKE